MPVLPPRVVGPLSECSSSVRVRGQITGATVELFITGQAAPIGGGVANWSDQTFPLNANTTLTAGATVQARQEFGTTSDPGPGITVQKKPPLVGPVVFQSHLYECGRCLWITGAVPGAKVEVEAGGVLRGSGIADDGNARLGLNPAINPNDALTAQQTACGTPGTVTPAPPPDPKPDGRMLPAPTIPGPLLECEDAVLVTDVIEGATVTLKRSMAPAESACFDASTLWFILAQPLKLNEEIAAQQDLPACKTFGTPSKPTLVGKATPVPPPTVLAPLCAAQSSVTLAGYSPGALIDIRQDGISLGTAQAPDLASFDFPVPPLTGNSVTARQSLCNRWSVDSNTVPIDPAPAGMPTPEVPGPLFACAAMVRVENVHPGARVYVFSTGLSAEIGDLQAFATHADVPVAPLLIAGDYIFAVQIGCGHTSHDSAPQLVKPAPALTIPKLPPLDDCMSSVFVNDVILGAQVDVYVNNLWRGSRASDAASVLVPIGGRLKVKDRVKARQRLCEHISEFSRPVDVTKSNARDWPMYHHDAQHSGAAGCSDITSATVASLKLKYPAIALNGHMISVPAIVDGKIYAGSSISTPGSSAGGGTLYKIDLATGAVEHQYSFVTNAGAGASQDESGIGCTPAVANGNVYFSALDGTVRCVDAAMLDEVWVTHLRTADLPKNQPVNNPGQNPEGWSSPLVVNGNVYVGFGEGEGNAFGFVYCLNATTGVVKWLFCTNQFVPNVDNQPNVVPSSTVAGAIPPGYTGFSIQPDPAVRGASPWSSCAYHAGLDRIFIGTGNPDPDSPLPNPPYSSGVIALDAATGNFEGFFQPSQGDNYRPDDSDIDVSAPPTVYSRPDRDVVACGSKSGAVFLLDPTTLLPLARRQLLPYDNLGNPLTNVDPRPVAGAAENLWGVFACAAVDPSLGHIYFGLGGYSGIDGATTPFLRTCDWVTLADAWPVAVGMDGVTRYSTGAPPMYATNEAGLSSPVVVNDVVLVTTSKPALYAFAGSNGMPLWIAPVPLPTDNRFSLGPAVSGNMVVMGTGSELLVFGL